MLVNGTDIDAAAKCGRDVEESLPTDRRNGVRFRKIHASRRAVDADAVRDAGEAFDCGPPAPLLVTEVSERARHVQFVSTAPDAAPSQTGQNTTTLAEPRTLNVHDHVCTFAAQHAKGRQADESTQQGHRLGTRDGAQSYVVEPL